MMRPTLLFACILWLSGLLYSGSLYAQPQSLSLRQCLELAVTNNFDVVLAQYQEGIAANNATKGNAGYLPTITGNAGASVGINQIDNAYVRLNNGSNNIVNNSHRESYNAGIGLNWKVFDGLKMQATYNKLVKLQEVGELSTLLTVETLVAKVTSLYYDIVQREIRLHNLEASMGLSRMRLQIANEKFMAGMRDKLEVLQAEVDFNADSSAYVMYIEDIRQLKLELNQSLQVPLDWNIVLQDTSIAIMTQPALEQLKQYVQDNNTSLKLYSKSREISELERKQVEAARYPYVNLSASYGYTGTHNSMGTYSRSETLGLNTGVTVGILLYDGANQRRLERNALWNIQGKKIEYQKQELQVMTDLMQLYSSYQNYTNLQQLERASIQLASQKVDLAVEKYRQGILTSLELRDVQRTLLDAQNRLTNAQYRAKYAEIYLMQLCGLGLAYLDNKKDGQAMQATEPNSPMEEQE